MAPYTGDYWCGGLPVLSERWYRFGTVSVFSFQESPYLRFVFRVIHADGDNFEIAIGETVGNGYEAGEFFNARRAPGSPDVNQAKFVGVVMDEGGDVGQVDSVQRDGRAVHLFIHLNQLRFVLSPFGGATKRFCGFQRNRFACE